MSESGPPPVNFQNLVGSFAAAGIAALQQIEFALQGGGDDSPDESDPSPEQQIQDGLAAVQHLIDTLTVLETKTAGNLTEEETQTLQTTLTELRFGYVRLSDKRSRRENA